MGELTEFLGQGFLSKDSIEFVIEDLVFQSPDNRYLMQEYTGGYATKFIWLAHPTNVNTLNGPATNSLSYLVTLFFIDDLTYWFFVFNCLHMKLLPFLLFYSYLVLIYFKA